LVSPDAPPVDSSCVLVVVEFGVVLGAGAGGAAVVTVLDVVVSVVTVAVVERVGCSVVTGSDCVSEALSESSPQPAAKIAAAAARAVRRGRTAARVTRGGRETSRPRVGPNVAMGKT
jgi:hypothetical protein